VKAVDGAGNESTWSDTWAFEVATRAEVTTKPATDITTSSAVLNAEIWYGAYSSVDVRFEYRVSGGSWLATDWTLGYTQTAYSTSLSGLSSGTTYEFRGHIRFDGLENKGAVRSFTTQTYVPPPPVVVEKLVYDLILRAIPERVIQGDPVTILFDVWRTQGSGVHDITFWLTIRGPKDKIYHQESFTKAVAAAVIEREVSTEGWPEGDYEALGKIMWPAGRAEAVAEFEVFIPTPYERVVRKIRPIWPLLVFAGGGVLGLMIVYLHNRRFLRRF